MYVFGDLLLSCFVCGDQLSVLKDLPVEDVECKSCYPHVLFFNKQRTFKDFVLVKDIFDHVRKKESIFDNWFKMEYCEYYERDIRNVYANCWLDSSYFPSGVKFEVVDSVEQVDGLRDGILYLHDIEMIFNSRGKLSDKDMIQLLKIVNNAGKHRVQIRGSCHRDMSVDVKLRSLINLWVKPVPYHSSRWLSSYTISLNIYGSDGEKIGFDCVDGLHRYASLFDTEAESYMIKSEKSFGGKPFRATPNTNP